MTFFQKTPDGFDDWAFDMYNDISWLEVEIPIIGGGCTL